MRGCEALSGPTTAHTEYSLRRVIAILDITSWDGRVVKALCLGSLSETRPAVGNRLGSNPSSSILFLIFASK